MRTERNVHCSWATALGLLPTLLFAPTALAQEEDEGGRMDPRADRLLRQMSDYLQSAESLHLRAEIAYDQVRSTGQKTLMSAVIDVAKKGPNRLHAHYQGDRRHNRAIFAGGSFVFVDVDTEVFAQKAVSADLDQAMDEAFETVGFSVPVADFFYANPYQTLIESARSGYWVGRSTVRGVPCHHLAFTHELIDWQLWIEDGPNPVPRRLVITYTEDFGIPEYTADLVEWDMDPHLSDSYFVLDPPPGAAEIDFLPLP